MKITCLKENLLTVLQTVSRVVSARATLPVLKNVLMQTEGGRLKVSATDLELGVVYWMGAKVEEEGALTVPAKLLMEYVTTLPNKKIHMEHSEGTLSLKCENFSASFSTIVADEFPEIPSFDSDTVFNLDAKMLKKAIHKVLFCTSKDDSRPVLQGIYFETQSEDNSIVFVGADGYRLVEKRITVDVEESIPSVSLIIPSRTMQEVSRIFHDDDQVMMTVAANQVIFSTDNVLVFSRLIEGKFPDYKKIIPDETSETIDVNLDRDTFLKAIKVTHLFAQDGSDAIHLNIDHTQQSLVVSASTNQVGQSATTLECQVKGNSENIAFNGHYLLDVLQVLEAPEVHMLVNGKSLPGVIYDQKDDKFIYVVMPVKQL